MEVHTPRAQASPSLGGNSGYKPGIQLTSKAPWGGAPWEWTDRFPRVHEHKRAQTSTEKLKYSFGFPSPSFLFSQAWPPTFFIFLSLMPHVVSGCPKFQDSELSQPSFARCSTFTVCSSLPFIPCVQLPFLRAKVSARVGGKQTTHYQFTPQGRKVAYKGTARSLHRRRKVIRTRTWSWVFSSWWFSSTWQESVLRNEYLFLICTNVTCGLNCSANPW